MTTSKIAVAMGSAGRIGTTTAESGFTAPDNGAASQHGPGERQRTGSQALNRLPPAEDQAQADGLSAGLQDQPPDSAAPSLTRSQLLAAILLTEPIHHRIRKCINTHVS